MCRGFLLSCCLLCWKACIASESERHTTENEGQKSILVLLRMNRSLSSSWQGKEKFLQNSWFVLSVLETSLLRHTFEKCRIWSHDVLIHNGSVQNNIPLWVPAGLSRRAIDVKAEDHTRDIWLRTWVRTWLSSSPSPVTLEIPHSTWTFCGFWEKKLYCRKVLASFFSQKASPLS